MDIKRAKQEIEHAVKAYLAVDDTGTPLIPPIRQRPILLMGPPGVGKTQIMEQIAQECGIALVAYTITHHTRQSAVGLPFIRHRNFGGADRSVTEYTMSEIIASVYDKMEQTGLEHGILFIDEINCVSETLAPTMLQFLQCKTFGNQAVPAGWVIVAAGNPPEYNKSVRDFDLVTLDRVRRIDIEPNLAVWQEYARAHRLHPAVQAYLELRPQHFYRIQNDVDGPQFVTARGWEDLSAVLERAQKAAFDERISLVSLLLAGLNTRFAAARRADAVTDACYQEMRSFKRTLNNADPAQDGFVPAAVFAAQVNVYADHLTAQKAAGTLTGEELAVVTTASALLHAWVAALDPALDRDAAFDAVRASFNAQVRKREDAVGLAGDALESAFDFMESAFADGQEMVVFVNELALGPDSAAYLADNECERFETYSKRLLLHSGQDDILAELQRDDIRQGEHSMEF